LVVEGAADFWPGFFVRFAAFWPAPDPDVARGLEDGLLRLPLTPHSFGRDRSVC
jgi:hypothetical protein